METGEESETLVVVAAEGCLVLVALVVRREGIVI